MALTGALFSGVSGINANGNAMNIIGDNIANANTIGFKSSRAVFFDLLSADVGGTKIGLGSRLAASSRLFVQGGVETTNSSTDLAIQGNGMFILKDSQGGTFYSRAGQFNIDANGNLANPAGLGWGDQLKLTSMYSTLIGDVNYFVVGGATPLQGNMGVVGVGLITSGVPGIPIFSSTAGRNQTPSGFGSQASSVLSIGYANNLGR